MCVHICRTCLDTDTHRQVPSQKDRTSSAFSVASRRFAPRRDACLSMCELHIEQPHTRSLPDSGLLSSVASRRFAPLRDACLSSCDAEDLASLGPRRRTSLPESAGMGHGSSPCHRRTSSGRNAPDVTQLACFLSSPAFLRFPPVRSRAWRWHGADDRSELCDVWFRD